MAATMHNPRVFESSGSVFFDDFFPDLLLFCGLLAAPILAVSGRRSKTAMLFTTPLRSGSSHIASGLGSRSMVSVVGCSSCGCSDDSSPLVKKVCFG